MELNINSHGALAGIRVLVVDDNDSMRSVIRRFLQRAGCTVLDAGCPSEAVSVARSYEGHLDLALVDLVMPEMSGPECADMLLEDRPELAVAYMSGYAEAVSGGYPEDSTPILLQKPFAREELVKAIRTLLDVQPAPAVAYTH